jgi:CHAD domain-containing protein
MTTPTAPTSRRTAAPFLGRTLRDLAHTLEATLPRVKERADDEAIHDMRVAIRRLRVLLKLSRKVFGRFHTNAVRAGLTRVHRASGALRDEEVLEETLTALHVHDAPFERWLDLRRVREARMRRLVIAEIDRGALAKPIALLRALLTLPVPKPVALEPFSLRCAERARKGVEKLRGVPTSDVQGLHELRIAYKGLRYTTELLGPVLPADLAAHAAPAARFQKRLGEIHDLDMAAGAIQRARTLPPRTQALVLGAIQAERRRAVQAYAREMHPSQAGAGTVRGRAGAGGRSRGVRRAPKKVQPR